MFGTSNQNNPEIENVAAEIMQHRIADIEALCTKTIALEAVLEAEAARAKASVDAMAALSVSEQTSGESASVVPLVIEAELGVQDVNRLTEEVKRLAA